jgi:hypothetical protein
MYKVFKDEVNRMIDKTSTGGGWNIEFTCNEQLDHNSLGRCTYHVSDRWARFAFNVAANKGRSRAEVKATARHEFGHFVTARLDRLAAERFISERELDEEMEAIARVFEKL